jgi:glycosidase
MKPQAILHHPYSEYGYQIDEYKIHLLLRVAAGDIKEVVLIHGDPFFWNRNDDNNYEWQMNQTKMELKYSDDLFDYFFVELEIPSKRVRYGFLVTDYNNDQLIYHSKGFSNVTSPLKIEDVNVLFNIPYLHLEDMSNTPSWVKETVWYQIFPDRFKNIDNYSKHDWNNEVVKNNEIYGGNIKGIIDKLDYIKDLGFNGIYLTPIFKANTAHKYDTVDYYQIDPSFGTNDEFKLLVKKAHELGIKIMLDGVFNHSGFYHPYFLDVAKNGKNSKYADCFVINKWPAVDFEYDDEKIYKKFGEPLNYETFATTPYMPKWNFKSKITQEHLLGVVRFWIEEFGIDAWRLDVSNEISFNFLRKIKEVARQADPNTYILGENWDPSLPWLQGDTLDGVMNYFLTTIIWNYVDLKIDNHEFRNRLVDYLVKTPKNIISNQFNLISSHDTERVLYRVSGNINRVKIAFALMFFSQGTPCVYYGDEIGMDGKGDPDNRRPMIWDKSRWNLEIFSYIKRLIEIRKQYNISDNEIKILNYDDLLILKSGKLLLVINNSNEIKSYNINRKMIDVINNNLIDFSKNNEIKPFESFILKEE